MLRRWLVSALALSLAPVALSLSSAAGGSVLPTANYIVVLKNAASVPAVASTQQTPSAPPTILSGETLAGEATSGGAHLDGMELNEDAIKAQQMVEQVSTLVRENPDAAASLVKRWLNRN